MELTEQATMLAERAEVPAGTALDREQIDAMVVEMVQGHAESLLRMARRHSICADDAHDAYQRGFEIFLKHASRLEPERAPAWMRTVVKHEALAIRRIRQRDMGPAEFEADTIEARNAPSPEEQATSSDYVERSAEALQRCKPQEVRALWLSAQGNSYDEIQEITGWTRTKVTRCIYEGRQSFLARYAGIESGAECERWQPLLSSLVDGEASTDELLELRPHLRRCSSCRAVVRELHRAQAPLAVVFPVAGVVLVSDQAEPAGHVFVRVYESVSNWLTERAASSIVRAQMLIDGAAGSAVKATAVAATAATVAGGGAVAIEHSSRNADARQSAVAPAKPARAQAQARERARMEAARLADEIADREAARNAAVAAASPLKPKPSRAGSDKRSKTGSTSAGSSTQTAPANPAPPSAGAGDLGLE